MTRMRIYILCVLGWTLWQGPVYAQRQGWENLGRGLNTMHASFWLERAYLHTDRTLYQAGETVWFKAWHTLGPLHHPSGGHVVLTLDLIGPDHQVKQTHLLRTDEGMACGSFLLPDTIPEGIYALELRSARMKDAPLSGAYTMDIHVVSPLNSFHSRKHSRKAHTAGLSVEFSPEGGPLLKGKDRRLGFRVTDGFGRGVETDYRITEGKHSPSPWLEHTRFNGMARTRLRPEEGKQYWLELRDHEGKVLRFRIPPAQSTGAALSLDNRPDELLVRLDAVGMKGPYLVLVQDMAGLRASRELPSDSGGAFSISTLHFSPGLILVTAFDVLGRPLSERRAFHGLRQLYMAAPVVDIVPGTDSLTLRIPIPDANAFGQGAASLSITTLPEAGSPWLSPDPPTLLAGLFLQPLLAPALEQPGWYFSGSPEADEALDEMLMTLGWSRFSWNDLARGVSPPLPPDNPSELSLRGKVTRMLLDLPAEGSIVKMTVMDRHFDQFTDTADAQGRFSFGGLVYEDTIRVLLEARLPDGRSQVLIEAEGALNAPTLVPSRFARPQPYRENEILALDRQYLQRERGNPRSVRGRTGIHREADYIVRFDEKTPRYTSPLEALVNVPGVDVQGSGINTRVSIRGNSTILLSNDPLYVVDGVPVDRYTVNSLDAGEVDRIEVLSGTRAAIYGLRGGQGVVAIFTRRGSGMKPGELSLKILGFTGCKEFHPGPPAAAMEQGIPRTLAWFPRLSPGPDGTLQVRIPLPSAGTAMEYRVEALGPQGMIFSTGLRPLP